MALCRQQSFLFGCFTSQKVLQPIIILYCATSFFALFCYVQPFHLSVLLLCVMCRIFSPEDDCEVIESDKHCHVFYQAEPDIWMVLVMTVHYIIVAIWVL